MTVYNQVQVSLQIIFKKYDTHILWTYLHYKDLIVQIFLLVLFTFIFLYFLEIIRSEVQYDWQFCNMAIWFFFVHHYFRSYFMEMEWKLRTKIIPTGSVHQSVLTSKSLIWLILLCFMLWLWLCYFFGYLGSGHLTLLFSERCVCTALGHCRQNVVLGLRNFACTIT